MDEVRSGRLIASSDVVKIMLRAADVLADLVRAARDGDEVDQGRSQALIEELRHLGPGGGDDEDGEGEGEGEEDWGDFEFKHLGAEPDAPAL